MRCVQTGEGLAALCTETGTLSGLARATNFLHTVPYGFLSPAPPRNLLAEICINLGGRKCSSDRFILPLSPRQSLDPFFLLI